MIALTTRPARARFEGVCTMKTIVTFAGLAAAALALSACGKKEEAPAAEPTAAEPEVMAAETPPADAMAPEAGAAAPSAESVEGVDPTNNPIGPS